MPAFVFAARSVAAALLVVTLAACAAPPDKELSTAQGAIDAARAAGAAEYAAADLATAEQTLARARTSVTERDYRAALAHALDAHLQAQAAAKAAAEGRARAQVAADTALDAFARRIDDVEAHLATPEAKRVPPAARKAAETAIRRALDTLATARAAVTRGELTAMPAIDAADAALARADGALTPPAPAKRTRPR